MDRTQQQLPHYHIRWSGKPTLDWERFNMHEDAVARAKQLVRSSETYTIEEHDGACQRCADAMNLKSARGTSKGAAA